MNGIRFNAFANLGLALEEVIIYWEKKGINGEHQCLWVDQICIDQSNPNERSHQVGLMRDIYAGAERVLACLTECDSERSVVGIQWAIEQSQWMQRHLSMADGRFIWRRPDPPVDLLDSARYFTELEKISLSTFQEGFVGFIPLCQRSWWKRAWICQEFISAVEVDFLCSGLSMPWQDFASVLTYLYKQMPELSNPGSVPVRRRRSSLSSLSTLDDESSASTQTSFEPEQVNLERNQLDAVRNLFERKKCWTTPGDIKVWLEHSKCCETSDPRDKVFAFLGLASPGYRIEADYSGLKSMVELSIEITRKILEFEKNLHFLYYIEKGRIVSDDSLLPSWVPEWTSTGVDRQFINFSRAMPASVQLHPALASQFTPVILPGDILRLVGIKIDCLGGMEKPWTPGKKKGTKTSKGLYILWWPDDKIQPSDCLWYLPAAGYRNLLVLRRKSDNWLFLSVACLHTTEKENKCWATYIVDLIMGDDFAGLLEREGLITEVIEIH